MDFNQEHYSYVIFFNIKLRFHNVSSYFVAVACNMGNT